MKKTMLGLLVLLFITFTFNGCGVAKVYNVDGVISSKKELSSIEKNIINAGNSLGWEMKAHPDGYIIGIIVLRSHSATVKITYDDKSYKINYISSVNLGYDENNHTIKSNYNGWISNLENTINNYLSELTMTDELKEKDNKSIKDKLSSGNSNEIGTKIKDINNSFKKIDNSDLIIKTILEAGGSLGWNMKFQEDGLILARIVIRSHSATIRVNYTNDSYQITYITSTNLNYTDEYTIHKNYNGWIENLSNAISARLNSL